MTPRSVTQNIVPELAKGGGHKFNHGHALVVSGGAGRGGAARLAARAALRIGTGLVTLAAPRSAMFENAAHLNAIMLRQLDGGHGLSELLEDERITALCLGPGMGLQADTQALVLTALRARRATVLDADALSRFQRAPDALFEKLHPACVLTPHDGEFGRVFPDLSQAIAFGAMPRVDAVVAAAARAGCIVLLKGEQTCIAGPDGSCGVHAATGAQAAPWLATAGSGDVLAGFICGLLARGFEPQLATETAVWIHAACARIFGPGLIAEDLPEQMPHVFRALARGEAL